MSTVRRTSMSQPAHAGPAVHYEGATERRWAFDASDVISLLAGLFYVVMGVLVLIEVGVSDFPSEETTQVFELTQTQIWGGIGIAIGLMLLAGAGTYGRSLTTFAGALLVVGGIVVVAALDELDATMATEETYGWVAIVAGALTLIAAIASPVVATRRERVVDDTVV
jgi:UDP-N-acetylmuramyl pentapeptide phosphotransferase/UDP-N-acetylglucosamine-1-phosphate transferase